MNTNNTVGLTPLGLVAVVVGTAAVSAVAAVVTTKLGISLGMYFFNKATPAQ